MSDVTVLKCWPACVDAIDWSPDGIIALASDERVELLFPNTIDYERDQDAPQWQHVSLGVPLFSIDHLPLKVPAPLAIYSVGEEISNSAPISIAWSPPGLSKHRGCALATLTANLILSIWSAEGKPQEESSWSRRLIINNALTEYFKDHNEEPSSITTSPEGRLRARSRVRAFAWAPALSCPERTGTVGTHLLYGQHLVALANDDNQIVFVVVNSPTSTLGVERHWGAEVLVHDSFTPEPENIFTEPVFFEDMMKQQRHICHIAWSPWFVRGDCYQSVIVYATNDDVRAKVVTYTHDNIRLGVEVIYPGFDLRYNGPMKWGPMIEDGDKLKLALFTHSGLVYLTISAQDASITEKMTHDLDGRWDPISGLVWDITEQCSPRLHISSLLSTLQNPTAILDMSSSPPTSLGSPSWREKLDNNLALFSVKNELKGNSKAKVWGLASSPLGDYIAVCNSVHPSDMIEYGIPADRSGTVAISSLRHGNQDRELFPTKNVSAEGLSYTLKKLAHTIEDPDKLPTFAAETVERLLQIYTPLPSPKANTRPWTTESDIYALIAAFKKVAFFDTHSLKDRYTILVSHAFRIGSSDELPKILIAYRLATALQRLPSSLLKTAFSTEIFAQHKQLTALIKNVMGSENTEEDPVDGNGSSTSRSTDSSVDTCDFCSAPIPLTDVTSASCMNGHQFPRCGLSFLAIQAPGITKYCGICSTPFLSDEFVLAQELQVGNKDVGTGIEGDSVTMGVEQNGEGPATGDQVPLTGSGHEDVRSEGGQAPTNGTHATQPNGAATEELDDGNSRKDLPVSLARVLFLACDVCIYCGGKFVG